MDINVKVAVRCRPLSQKEINKGCKEIIKVQENGGKTIHVEALDAQHQEKDFTFDFCYFKDSTQEQVYSDLGRPMISQAMEGFNGTIFAYGQTGSGKSHSMTGNDSDKGIIPRINDDLWSCINKNLKSSTSTTGDMKYMVTVSFLEIYNEVVKDLLNPSEKALKIRESPQLGIYVEGLCELIVRDSADVLKLIEQGNTVRRVAATNMNEQSSRSHSCFTIKLEQKTTTTSNNSTVGGNSNGNTVREQLIKAKVNLVDLAGSERASKTGASGSTLKEGANINMSLMALGNVINALSGASEGGNSNLNSTTTKKHIPYRDSKLTRLLQESLGGNSATVMLAAISPADYNYEETVGTLKYAYRAKSIANAVVRNEDMSERLIKDLKNEIEQLKLQMAAAAAAAVSSTAGTIVIVDPELETKLRNMEEEQRNNWEERERLSRALEEERNQNMNTAVSSMMAGVKQQKVQRMKNIRRLTNEKVLLSKKFKEEKDVNAGLKQGLDGSMKEYQKMQGVYDEMMEAMQSNNGETAEMQQIATQAEQIATQMSKLLMSIEDNRNAWVARREALKGMKNRLSDLEDEVTDERAELVATAGLLDQNEKLRVQIQEEERAAAKVMIDSELSLAREVLEKERLGVRGAIEEEISSEMSKLKTELNTHKFNFQQSTHKVKELEGRVLVLQQYADELEGKVADAEVAEEFSQREISRLDALQIETARVKDLRILELESRISEQSKGHESIIDQLKAEEIINYNRKIKQLTDNFNEEKFQLFSSLMDNFELERKSLTDKLNETQKLLIHAGKDVIFLSQNSDELRKSLSQALHWEGRPPR